MLCISVKEFLFWKKKQLSKGGDQQSFAVLLDCIAGIPISDLNLITTNIRGNLHLRKNLELAQSLHVSGTLTFKFEGIDYGRRGYEAKNQRGAR